MHVIKLGGSLSQADALLHCINRIEQHYQNRMVVIVPGGGVFAEQVRVAQARFQFDDYTAHCMALLAMQQTALLIKGLMNDVQIAHSVHDLKTQLPSQKTLIWSPEVVELDRAGVPATWAITSDSLAAWLAKTLQAKELILVKSAHINPHLSLQQLAKQHIIDQGFCEMISGVTFKIRILNHHHF